MPPKLSKKQQNLLLQEQSEAELDSSSLKSTSKGQDLPLLSDLQPKPCFTCGREITPRAKWLRNWDSITACSDGCKAQKPSSKNTIIKVKKTLSRRELDNLEVGRKVIGEGNLSIKVFHEEQQVENNEEEKILVELELDLERWVEDVLLRMTDGSLPMKASTSSSDLNSETQSGNEKDGANGKSSSKSNRNDNLVSCSQVEAQLVQQAENIFPASSSESSNSARSEVSKNLDGLIEPDEEEDSRSSRASRKASPEKVTEPQPDSQPESSSNLSSSHSELRSPEDDNPFLKALKSSPGLRERVRRASRRLLIFDRDSTWLSERSKSIYDHPLLDNKKLSLVNDGKRLHSLKDVSFAKGEIFLRLVDRRG